MPTTRAQAKPKRRIRIFLSHSATDADIASGFIRVLTDSLMLPAEEIRCTSVDGHKLPAGGDVADILREEATSVEWLIGLLTPNAVASSWVLFEVGAAWGAKRNIVPLIAFGLKFNELPATLKNKHAIVATDQPALQQLVDDIAADLGVETNPPAKVAKTVADFAQLCAAAATKHSSALEKPKGAPRAATKVGDFELMDLVRRLKNEPIEVPGEAIEQAQGGKWNLMDVMLSWDAALADGVVNTWTGVAGKFLWRVGTKLMSYGLVAEQKLPASKHYRQIALSKDGIRLLNHVRLLKESGEYQAGAIAVVRPKAAPK